MVLPIQVSNGLQTSEQLDLFNRVTTFSHSQPPPLTSGVLHNIVTSEEWQDLKKVGKLH